MFYSDDYLSGLEQKTYGLRLIDLDAYVHEGCGAFNIERYDYESISLGYDHIRNCTVSTCKIDDNECRNAENANPYLPQGNPFPPKLVISRIWDIVRQECSMNKDTHLLVDNNCLNERFGRADEPAGSEKCREYYFWGLVVKSRPCMIKNAKLEEFDKYEICGQYDDAFLCTKDSIIYKQKLQEESKLRHIQDRAEKINKESQREEAKKILHSNSEYYALAKRLSHEESEQFKKCLYQNDECHVYIEDVKKGNNKVNCDTYSLLDIEAKSRRCIEKFGTKEDLSLYEACGIRKNFICLKGSFAKYQSIADLIRKANNYPIIAPFNGWLL